MLLQIAKTDLFDRRFLAALVLALLFHGFVFTCVIFTLRGMPRQYMVDMSFWGSFLRKQDLQPLTVSSVREVGKVLVLESSALLGGEHEKAMRASAWQLGVMVDKPEASRTQDDMPDPQKFLTDRVEIDAGLPEAVPGIPDAPRVPLRMPRP